MSGCAADESVAGTGPIVDASGNGIGELTLYFSSRCGTNWGQARFDDGNPASTPPVTVSVIGTQAGLQYGTPPVAFTYTGAGSPVWGNMVYSPGCAYATVTRGSARGQAVQVGCPPPSTPGAGKCQAQSCTGQDPYATGCASGDEVAGRAPLAGGAGTVTLYWSPTCQTNWGEASFSDGNPPSTPPVTIAVVGTTGPGEYDTPAVSYTTTGSGSPVWGNMVYSPGCAYARAARGRVAGLAVQAGCGTPSGPPPAAGNRLNASGTSIQVAGGAAVDGVVGRFLDSDTALRPPDLVATIDWGDGTPQAGGQVVGLNGEFAVGGFHRYPDPTRPGVATAKGYSVSVTLVDRSGATATAYTSVEVVGRDLPVVQPRDGSSPGESGGEKAWSIASGAFSTLVGGAICAVGVEIPVLDALGCIDAGMHATETGAAIADPPDRHFRRVFHARVPRLGRVPRRCAHTSRKLCAALHAAEVRYLRAYLRVDTFAEDAGVTANRFGGAERARNRKAERLQRTAERRYFARWKRAVAARRAAGRALGRLLQRHGLDRRVSAAQIARGRSRLLSANLSRAASARLRRDGLVSRRARLHALLRTHLSWAAPPADTTLAAVLGQ